MHPPEFTTYLIRHKPTGLWVGVHRNQRFAEAKYGKNHWCPKILRITLAEWFGHQSGDYEVVGFRCVEDATLKE